MGFVVKFFEFSGPEVSSSAPVQEQHFDTEEAARAFAQACYDDPRRAVPEDSLQFVTNQ